MRAYTARTRNERDDVALNAHCELYVKNAAKLSLESEPFYIFNVGKWRALFKTATTYTVVLYVYGRINKNEICKNTMPKLQLYLLS